MPADAVPEQQLVAAPWSSAPIAMHAQVPPDASPLQQLAALPWSLVPFARQAQVPAALADPEQQFDALP
jgi:hypothetical protein